MKVSTIDILLDAVYIDPASYNVWKGCSEGSWGFREAADRSNSAGRRYIA